MNHRSPIATSCASLLLLLSPALADAATSFRHASGGVQAGTPGAALPAPLVVQLDTNQPNLALAWYLQDGTGGARFSDGSTFRTQFGPTAGNHLESVTAGPNPGVMLVFACVGAFRPGTSTREDFECEFDLGIASFTAIVGGADGPLQESLSYLGGGGQTSTPGVAFAKALSVRNDFGADQNIVWTILPEGDLTGGARFANGSTAYAVPAPNGTTASTTVIPGPNPGLVTVIACRAPTNRTTLDYCGELDRVEGNGKPFALESVSAAGRIVASGPQVAGSTFALSAPLLGDNVGAYLWDLDGDGIIDDVRTTNRLEVSYPTTYSGNVRVSVYGTESPPSTRGVFNLPVSTTGPSITVTQNGAPTQICGDGPVLPGTRYSLPVRVRNEGTAATGATGALSFVSQQRSLAGGREGNFTGQLLVDTPLVDIGVLAPGASVDKTIQVSITKEATCNTAYGVLYSGFADNASSSPGSSIPIGSVSVIGNCFDYAGTCPAPAASAKAAINPRQGMYFNSARPGNGMSNFLIPVPGGDPIFFGAWFTALPDRTPVWYIVQGPMVGNTVIAPIRKFKRNVAEQGFSVSSNNVGQAVITLKSDTRMLMLYQIGSKVGLEFMDYFVGGPVPTPNRNGAWYNQNESGWGQVIHEYVINGTSNLFSTNFLYDPAGEPRWVIGQGRTADFAAVNGVSHQSYETVCPGCPWIADWTNSQSLVGVAKDVFLSNTTATTTTSFSSQVTGIWTRIDLPLQLLTSPQ